MSDEQKWEKSSSSGKPSTLGQTQKELGLRVIFFFSRLLNCLDQILAVMVLSQHQVSSSKTVRPRGPCGARCMGHTRTWSSTCSTWLQPLFQKLNFLRLNKIFKFEIAKFMVKFHSNKLPQFCEEYLKIFVKVSSVHTHYTRSSFSNEYYVPRTFYHKTDQSLRVIGAKIWNDLPKCLRNKLITTSFNHSSKLLEQHFLGTHFN